MVWRAVPTERIEAVGKIARAPCPASTARQAILPALRSYSPFAIRHSNTADKMAHTTMPGLERRLKATLLGEVAFDPFTRGRYATDASHYQVTPIGVVTPRSVEEAGQALTIAREEGVSVLPRGGGTSQSGQTVNASLVIDCS